MKKFKAAVIGCGNISDLHLKALAKLDFVEISAVCDTVKARADVAALKYGANAYYDVDRMLADEYLDCVHICLPHYLHALTAIKALNKGVSVFTEKPMAMNLNEARQMVEASKKSGAALGVCFQNRYNETTLKLKSIISSGELGRLKSIKGEVTWERDREYYDADDWRGTLKYEGGGVVINQAAHTLDLISQLSGGRLISAKTSISCKKLFDTVETEDTADAFLTFDNGVTAVFFATLCNGINSPVMLELSFERGRAVLYDELTVYDENGEKQTSEYKKADGKKSYWGLSHEYIIADFYSCLKSGADFPVSGENALETTRIIDEFYKDRA